MIAADLISTRLFPLKKNDTVENALILMQDWQVYQLPVVEGGKVIGTCDSQNLLKQKKSDKIIHHLNKLQVFIHPNQHLFEIIKLFSELQLNTITVVDEEIFLGIISGVELLEAYKKSSLSQPGAIIKLQMPSRNYSLTEISRLVESNDVKILHLFIASVGDEDGHIELSLKLNSNEIKNVLTTLERYNYQITGVYNAASMDDSFKSRFENLIKYLNS